MSATGTLPRSIDEIEVRGALTSAGEISIAAPIDVVWHVLTTFADWPDWNSLVRSISVLGGPTEGTVLRWKAGPSTITAKILRVEAPCAIAWSGNTIGIKAVHVWRLRSSGDDTFVRTEESFDGVVARVFRRVVQRGLDDGLERGLADLKGEAERRATRTA